MKFEESMSVIYNAINSITREAGDIEDKFISSQGELERTRTVLEALRQDPYEFWVAAAYMPGNINGDGEEMIVSSFTLENDLIDFLSDHVDYVTSYEKQTMPSPVAKLKALLSEARSVIHGTYGTDEKNSVMRAIEEVLNENR